MVARVLEDVIVLNSSKSQYFSIRENLQSSLEEMDHQVRNMISNFLQIEPRVCFILNCLLI